MHFALPPRKTSFPPPYARVSAKNTSDKRTRQVQYLGYLVCGILTIYLLFSTFSSDSVPTQNVSIPLDSSVLIVTLLDDFTMSDDHISMIKKNRDDYAARHGYQTLYTNVSTYSPLTQPAPTSWTLIPALRHALTTHSEIDYIWSLSPHALIMNPTLSLYDHVFSNLTRLMLRDIPVVPPDSVIHTFSHLKPSQAYLILTQDMDNVAPSSFLLRNTQTIPVAPGQPRNDWSNYFLDAWFDPLYRAYAFQKAENHALEHIIQWHPTVLAKLVIVEQRIINSYNVESKPSAEELLLEEPREHDSMWKQGDLIINFKGCAEMKDRDCEDEMRQSYKIWQDQVSMLGTNTIAGAGRM